MFDILKFILSFLFSGIILFLVFKFKLDDIKISRKNSIFLIFFSILTIILEYWILGPHSYMQFYDEADQGLSRILYDLNNEVRGTFSHNIMGGSDHYASLLVGGQNFSLERFIFSLFPTWISVLLHKFLLVGINFIGFYLLIRKLFKIDRLQTIFFSFFAALINPYATISTLSHGLGYGLIPISIYVFYVLNNKKNYLIYTTFLSSIIAISTTVTHAFLVLVSGLVISFPFFKIENLKKFFLSFFILIFLTTLNWLDSILGFYEYGKLTNRVNSEQILVDNNLLGIIPWLWKKTNIFVFGPEYQYSPLILILFMAAVISIFNNYKKNLKYINFLILTIYFPMIVIFFIKLLKLNFLKSVNYNDIALFIVVPTVLLVVRNIANHQNKLTKILFASFIFFGSLLFFDKKFVTAKNLLEGQQLSKITDISNLKDKKWNKNEFRVVSALPYYYYHPNFSWIYNLETLDGYINLAPSNYTDFWQCGIFEKTCNSKGDYTRGSLYLNFIPFQHPFKEKLVFDQNQNILIDQIVDINILKLVNTKYILSFHNINSEHLKLISRPEKNLYEKNFQRRIFSKKRDKDIYYESFKESILNLFNVQDIFIYEILEASDRIFFPRKIINKKYDSQLEKYDFISENYIKNILFTNIKELKPGVGKIEKIIKIKNGYEFKIKVNQAGLIVINNFYNPYLKAFNNEKEKKIINLNDYQIGIIVDEDEDMIKLVYSRKTFFEKIKLN